MLFGGLKQSIVFFFFDFVLVFYTSGFWLDHDINCFFSLGWFLLTVYCQMRVIMSLCAADEKSEKSEKTLNGEEKTDSGVETQNSEGNVEEEDPLGPNCYYDKSKSFFDNISCDDTRWELSFSKNVH